MTITPIKQFGGLSVICVHSFLGLLHMEVFHQRLEQEHGADVITTAPTVPFHLHFPDKTLLHIQNP